MPVSYRSRWTATVRWAECDAAGIIYHAHVFDWFSEARIRWLADHQLDYYERLRPHGLELLVKNAAARFHHTLKLGDPITLTVGVGQLSPTRMEFYYQIAVPGHAERVAIEGTTDHAFVVDGKARRLDRALPEIFESFCVQSGQSGTY